MTWIILSVLAWGALHSLLASNRVKEWASRLPAGRGYRLFYNLVACLTFLPVVLLLFLLPSHHLYTVPMPWSVFLLAGQGLALVVLVAGFLQMDVSEFLGVKPLTGGQSSSRAAPLGVAQGSLLVSGLYRHVRHPLYSAGIAFIWLMPWMTTGILAVNAGLTLYVIIGALLEERKLLRQYGDEYRQYAARTPMFIPFLKGNKKGRGSV